MIVKGALFCGRPGLMAAMCLGAMAISGSAFAQATAFDIPAQPAGAGVAALARQGDVQVLISAEDAQGRRTNAVNGSFPVGQALELLLRDTGLAAFPTGARTWTVIGQQAAGPGSAPAPASVTAIEGVVVTGSRVVTDQLALPSMITMLGADELSRSAPKAIIDSLAVLPSLAASNSARNALALGGVAQSAEILNLRNLGGNRTLVLVDGRRHLHTGLFGTGDIRLIPQSLVSRVDIVTGGASAAYGSDAVAGVVNFVLEKDFQGLKANLQAGVSQRGDGYSHGAGVTGGASFADGRVHLLASVSLAKQEPIFRETARPWGLRNAGLVIGVPGAAPPNERTTGIGSPATYGGVILSGPLVNTQFLPGGIPAPFQPGRINTPFYIVDSPDTAHTHANLVGGYDYVNPFVRLAFDYSPGFRPYAQIGGSANQAEYRPNDSYHFGPFAYTIFRENPFIPAPVQARMDAESIQSFQLHRQDNDFGMIRARQSNGTYEIIAGFDGTHADWDYNFYVVRGQTETRGRVINNVNRRNLFAAADAVIDPGTGSIVCRVALSHPDLYPGCIPINLFGAGTPSPGAIRYVTGVSEWRLRINQDVASFSARGPLFDIGTEPVRAAFGLETRRETMTQTVDANSTAIKNADGAIRGFPTALQDLVGGWLLANDAPAAGSYQVNEIFAEANVPLLRNAAPVLDLNAAARHADYSTSGGVTTWKLGLNYHPVAALALRGALSRDTRAANLGELYTPATSGFNTVVDSVTGRGTAGAITSTSGNPNLEPERATTYTFGAAYQPAWAPRLKVSLDYYNISVLGAIMFVSPQQMVNQCAAGSAPACANLIRSADGNLQRINLPHQNFSELGVDGIDLEVSMDARLDQVAPWLIGDLQLRGFIGRLGHYTSQVPGGAKLDTAGVVGVSANPRWQAKVGATYRNGPLSLFVQQRFISAGRFDANLVEGVSVNNNKVQAAFYTDLTAEYVFPTKRGLRMFAAISNLFDAAPPPADSLGSSFLFRPQTNHLLYDTMGRYFSAGLSMQY